MVNSGSARGTATNGNGTYDYLFIGGDRQTHADGGVFLHGKDYFVKSGKPEWGDRWVRVSSYSVILAEPKQTADCLAASHGALALQGMSDVGGQPALVLFDRGNEPGTAPTRYYVAADGTPRLLRIEWTGPNTSGQDKAGGLCDDTTAGPDHRRDLVTFSNFGQTAVVATAPPHPLTP